MRYQLTSQGQSMAIIVIWLLDAGAGIGLYGQGHFILAMLALALFPVALLVGLLLLSAAHALVATLADRYTPLPRHSERAS